MSYQLPRRAKYRCNHRNVRDLPHNAVEYRLDCSDCCLIAGKHDAMISVRAHYGPIIDGLALRIEKNEFQIKHNPNSLELREDLQFDKDQLEIAKEEQQRRNHVICKAIDDLRGIDEYYGWGIKEEEGHMRKARERLERDYFPELAKALEDYEDDVEKLKRKKQDEANKVKRELCITW